MISALHLLWIIPVSGSVGAVMMGIIAGRRKDE